MARASPASHTAHTRDGAHDPDTCPREPNGDLLAHRSELCGLSRQNANRVSPVEAGGAGAATSGREGGCRAGPGAGGDGQHPGGHSEGFVGMAWGPPLAPLLPTPGAPRGDAPPSRGLSLSAPACLGWTPARFGPVPAHSARPGEAWVLAGPGSGSCGEPQPHTGSAERGGGRRAGGARRCYSTQAIVGWRRAGGRPDGPDGPGLRTEACAWADGVLRAFRWRSAPGGRAAGAGGRAALRWFLAALLGLEGSSGSVNSSRISFKTLFPGERGCPSARPATA